MSCSEFSTLPRGWRGCRWYGFGQGHQSEKEWDNAFAGEFCPVVRESQVANA